MFRHSWSTERWQWGHVSQHCVSAWMIQTAGAVTGLASSQAHQGGACRERLEWGRGRIKPTRVGGESGSLCPTPCRRWMAWQTASILCLLECGHRAKETLQQRYLGQGRKLPYHEETLVEDLVASGCSSCHFGTTTPLEATEYRIRLLIYLRLLLEKAWYLSLFWIKLFVECVLWAQNISYC